MIELAAVIIAVALVVLVGFIVPTVIQVRKTATQAEQLLSQVNAELPGILKEVKQTNENVRAMSDQAREGMGRATVLLHAIGDVGETVNQVHGMIRGQSASLARNVVKLLGRCASRLTQHQRARTTKGRAGEWETGMKQPATWPWLF